jgi:hypothetical protein
VKKEILYLIDLSAGAPKHAAHPINATINHCYVVEAGSPRRLRRKA